MLQIRTLQLAVALVTALPLAISAQQSADALQKLVPPVPTPASFIADVPGILSQPNHAALDDQIRAIQTAGLGDIGVAILPNIGDYAPNQVSVAIYRTWRVGSVAAIGSAHKDVGVLLLIVPKELTPNKKGECYILTGTGAEGIITDAAAGTICRDMVIPFLKERNYFEAIRAGVAAIEARLRGDEGLTAEGTSGEILPPPAEEGGLQWWHIPGGIVALLASIVGSRRWRRYRTRKCPKCGKPMTRLSETADNTALKDGQRVEEQIHSVDYDVWSCTCGGELIVPYKKLFTRYKYCRECHNRTAWAKRRTIVPATTSSSGSAEDTWHCKACPATWTTMVVLPRISTSSSSSGGSSGGGGGSSFGGSGSSSGGGGGGSY